MLLTKILFVILFLAFVSGQKVHFWRRSTVANRFFAHKLYHQVARNTVITSNVFVSPYAVSAGLSMCLYGSDGGTAEQLVRALEYQDIDDARQHLQNDPEKHEKIARLYQKMKEQLIDVDHGFILNAPNKIFSGDVVLQDYMDGVLKYFNSETMQVDFAGDVETAIEEINDFVYDATNGTIEEAVSSDSVDSSTKLVLVSTLFFNGAWKFPFDPKMTKMGDFTLYDGTTVPAEFMVEAMAVNFCNSYGDEEGELPVVYVELPYKTDSSRYGIVMELILPHEKGENAMRQVENGIDEGTMSLLRKKAYKAGVQVRLPKFSIEYARDLVDDLKHMGINDMFDPLHADFSLINGKRNLFFSSAQHKTYLEVNERGTVASASFAAASTRSTAYASFDRPFFVILREVYTRMPLFMGRISNPNQ